MEELKQVTNETVSEEASTLLSTKIHRMIVQINGATKAYVHKMRRCDLPSFSDKEFEWQCNSTNIKSIIQRVQKKIFFQSEPFGDLKTLQECLITCLRETNGLCTECGLDVLERAYVRKSLFNQNGWNQNQNGWRKRSANTA